MSLMKAREEVHVCSLGLKHCPVEVKNVIIDHKCNKFKSITNIQSINQSGLLTNHNILLHFDL